MTEYTPTTREVEETFVRARPLSEVHGRRAGFSAWLAERDRQVAELAWAEGFVQATDFMDDPALPTPLNPYRKEAH